MQDFGMSGWSNQARDLLRGAFDLRYRYPVGFEGFSALCRIDQGNSEDIEATVAMVAAGNVEAVLASQPPNPTTEAWLMQELRSLSRGLWGHDFDAGEGKFAMSLTEPDHPLGPLVQLHDDPHQASFRIRGGRITMSSRRQQSLREILQFHRWHVRPDGRWLPAQYTSEIWEVGVAGPLRVDRYTDLYWPVEGELFPQLRRVKSADDLAMTSSCSATLREWQLAGHRAQT